VVWVKFDPAEFEVPGMIPARKPYLETTRNVVGPLCFAAKCGERRTVELAAVLGRTQGPLLSLPMLPSSDICGGRRRRQAVLAWCHVRKKKEERDGGRV